MPALLTARALVRLSGNIPASTQRGSVYIFGEVERIARAIARDHKVDGPAPAVAHAIRASLRGRMLGRRNPGLPRALARGVARAGTAPRRCSGGNAMPLDPRAQAILDEIK